MSSVVKGLGARLFRYSVLAMRTAAMYAFLSSRFMESRFILKMGHFHGP